MHHRSLLGAAVIAVLVLLPAGAASAAGTPANVKVRVEGAAQTLVPLTTVRTTATDVVMDGHACSGTSDGGALNAATAGDWHGTFSATYNSFSLETIKGEKHASPDPEYWSVWINGRYATKGTCANELQEGDDLLYFVDRCDYDAATQSCSNPPIMPLELSGPRTVRLGAAFTVAVISRDQDGSTKPISGATVTGGGQSATTDGAGHATLTLGARGDTTFVASKPGLIRTGPVPFCATDGADGFCGTTSSTGSPPPPPGCVTTGNDGLCGTFDRRAPHGRILSIAEHQRFARGKGPRRLSGRVDPDPSGIRAIRLRLTRNDGGRCSTFDGARERFVKLRRCGATHGKWFSVGDRQDWSYLLPSRLRRGRYVLDVRATDKNGNVDATLQRARNRVVFVVR